MEKRKSASCQMLLVITIIQVKVVRISVKLEDSTGRWCPEFPPGKHNLPDMLKLM